MLRTGGPTDNVLELANRLLAEFGGLGGIDQASEQDLCRVSGVGPVKATELKAVFELGRRVVSLNPGDRPKIGSPRDIANLVMAEMSAFGQEHLRVLQLNIKNQVLGSVDLYRGSLNSASVRVGEVFRDAIRQNSAAIVLIHNHPSGDPTPSPQDIELTRQVVSAGELLDISVLDHVIIGQQRHVSLKEQGLGFGPGA